MVERREGIRVGLDGTVTVACKDPQDGTFTEIAVWMSTDEMRMFAHRMLASADIIDEHEKHSLPQDALNKGREAGKA
jgi:hypothetical protein